MLGSWPSPVAVPDDVICRAVPENAVFLDTNTALHTRIANALRGKRSPLVSAVVFAELLARKLHAGYPDALAKLLQGFGIRVVLFDEVDATQYWRLLQPLQFKHPIVRPGENVRACRNRLRFDLLIFSVALRHRKLLLTNNTTEFELLPFREGWKQRDSYIDDLERD